jgi:very-short-patch-repair endonuclease
MQPADEGTSDETREQARSLRRTATPVEQRLWERLRNKNCGGFKFRRQVPMGRYIADLARTQWFEDRGYLTIRFTNANVASNVDGVFQAIETLCIERSNRQE